MKIKKTRMTKHLECINIHSANAYVKLCYDAIKELKGSKFYVNTMDDEASIYERNFVISLAYLLGKAHSKQLDGYLINGEIHKEIFHAFFNDSKEDEKHIKNTADKLRFKADYVSPDFLIHKYKKMKDISKGGQKLIVEVKAKANLKEKDFYRDFFKLNVYISRLKFQKALYLIVNNSVTKVDEYIKKYISQKFYISDCCKKKLNFIILENVDGQTTPKLFNVDV